MRHARGGRDAAGAGSLAHTVSARSWKNTSTCGHALEGRGRVELVRAERADPQSRTSFGTRAARLRAVRAAAGSVRIALVVSLLGAETGRDGALLRVVSAARAVPALLVIASGHLVMTVKRFGVLPTAQASGRRGEQRESNRMLGLSRSRARAGTDHWPSRSCARCPLDARA